MGPVIVAALRTLFSRAAIEAAGKVAVSSVAPRAGARMMAARAAQAEAGTPAVQKGMARFFRGSGEMTAGNRWLTPNLSQAQAAASRTGSQVQYVDIPKDSPHLKGMATNRGWLARAKHASFEAPDEIAKGLQPYRAAESAPRQPIRDTLAGYAQQFASNVGQRARSSSIGQYYSAAMDVVRTRDPNNGEPPKNRPNADPFGNFPNLSLDQLSALSGKSYAEFQAADKSAEQELKRKEVQDELERSTQKLNEAFKNLLGRAFGLTGKLIVAPLAASAAITALNGRMLDADASRYSRLNSTYAGIQAARTVQDIQIDRRSAAATAGSAALLNSFQMQGRDSFARLSADLANVRNIGMSGLQYLANIAADAGNTAITLTGIRAMIQAMVPWMPEEKMGNLAKAIQVAIQGQRAGEDRKRRKPIGGM